MKRLKAALNVVGIEITGVNCLDRLNNLSHRDYDLVAVDVGLEHLVRALITLRSKPECVGIPVLVESSRISSEIGLDGVLPKYRAMPCRQSDIVTLVKRRLAFESGAQKKRGIL
jgi:hypothetical protein